MSPPPLFPAYLRPALPFRRRKSSTDSAASTSSITSSSSPPETSPSSPTYLSGHTSHLRCARCLADLALSSQIVSKGFTGRHGRAYLVAPGPITNAVPPPPPPRNHGFLPNLPNTYTSKPVPRHLVTGAHTVSDLMCANCSTTLGWKYVAAEQEAQRYKVGKFILETNMVCQEADWESGERGVEGGGGALMGGNAQDDVAFDSQDEEECEDLFLGAWTPKVAAARRRRRKALLD